VRHTEKNWQPTCPKKVAISNARQAAQGILRYFDSADNSTIRMKSRIYSRRCAYPPARIRHNGMPCWNACYRTRDYALAAWDALPARHC